jgi:dUTP pyrophosphatase
MGAISAKIAGEAHVTEERKVMEKLYIQLLESDVKVPVKQNSTDSGFDLYAYSFKKLYQNFGSNGERLLEGKLLDNVIRDNSIDLSYLERVLIGTGIMATVGSGYELQIRPRSGLALKQGLTVLNTPGTIDCSYTKNEICVILINLSRQVQTVNLGERIAQIVPKKVELLDIEVVKSLPGEDRGGGFGHTGTK